MSDAWKAKVIVAFVPATRTGFGLCGTIKRKYTTLSRQSQGEVSVGIELDNVRLTPDWEDPARVALRFGQRVNIVGSGLFFGDSEYHIVVKHANKLSAMTHAMRASYIGEILPPMRVEVQDIPELRKEPYCESVNLHFTVSEHEYKHFYGGKITWDVVVAWMMETMKTSSATTWTKTSSTLKKMLSQPHKS